MILKKLVCSAVVVGVLGFMSTASAELVTLSDITTFSATGILPIEDAVPTPSFGEGLLNVIESKTDFLTWTHHYNAITPSSNITDADLWLTFEDNGGTHSVSHVKIVFDDLNNPRALMEGNTSVNGTEFTTFLCLVNAPFNVSLDEIADGQFNVRLDGQGNEGKFATTTITQSELRINYTKTDAPPANVPEPSILTLLGLSLLGLGFVRRRK